MKQFKIKIEEENIKGFVEIKVKKFKDRLKLIKEFSKMNDDDSDSLSSVIKVCEENVVNLELDYSGEKITSLDDLGYYEDGIAIYALIARNIISGVKLKKQLKAS